MSARESIADAAYEKQADHDDAPSGRVIDNSYAMGSSAGVSKKQGTGPSGSIGVNPVIKDDDPVEDPIDPNMANSKEMLGKLHSDA